MARVLVLSDLWLPFPGGAERLLFNLARDLQRRGHAVHALTGYEHPHQFDGCTVGRADISLDADGWQIIANAVAVFKPDVLVVHHLYARRFHTELAALGVPMVEVVLNGQRMPEAALAVFISEWVAERGDRQLGDVVLRPWAEPDVVAAHHGDAIGFIKPYPHKGVARVARIAQAMPDRRFMVLRGEWPTLEDVTELEPLPNVWLLSPVLDMRDFYRLVRLLLVPSISEDAGTVAQEATANGLPCLSTNVDGLAETNAGGVQFHLESPTRLWVRAIRLLDNPANYRQQVARQLQMQWDPEPALAAISNRIGAL